MNSQTGQFQNPLLACPVTPLWAYVQPDNFLRLPKHVRRLVRSHSLCHRTLQPNKRSCEIERRPRLLLSSSLIRSANDSFRSDPEMKERNSTSTLKRILVNCASQAKDYGSCVAGKVPQVERDMCLKEFLALKACMQNMLRGKF
ncbi:hypothetical protein NE237_003893 [Protea cynaroides]|uniref:IMS import disulfide relay-system CHCH-CHCH-like Cx9C domain-containing protein n=1 Tax=Protea cynaroides TaxID=273540 RepID=A0A9Q0KIC6_9MAGN|nr:hypothetical protein NE237_003893 [Protea cynaroides]